MRGGQGRSRSIEGARSGAGSVVGLSLVALTSPLSGLHLPGSRPLLSVAIFTRVHWVSGLDAGDLRTGDLEGSRCITRMHSAGVQ